MVWGSTSLKSCDAILKRVEENDPSLVDLIILPIKTFGEIEIERLSIAFRKNAHLQSIHASGHELSSSALSKLASSLMDSSVKIISIGHSNMGDDGVVAFCSPLEVHHGGHIQSLDFEYKNVGPKGMDAIGRTFRSSNSLVELRLGRNQLIGDTGLISLVHAANLVDGPVDYFPSLKLLDISACGIGSTGLEQLTTSLVKRKSNARINLILDDNPLGASSCHSLSLLLSGPYLSSLSIKGCSIGDEGLEILCSSMHTTQSSGLNSLNLSDNRIGSTGARYLADLLRACGMTLMVDLKELNLSMNALGTEGVSLITTALHQQTGIGSLRLDLTCTLCGVEGAISALSCNFVRSLILFNNSLGSDGFLALAPLLKGGHPIIEYLDLGGNFAQIHAVYDILTALAQKNDSMKSNLKTIILGGNETNDAIEKLVNQLALTRPELDVAFDRSDRIQAGNI